MPATFDQRTAVQLQRLADAEKEGRLAGIEFQNLREDLSWDRETWEYLIELIQVNPYESGECEDVPVAERPTLATRWTRAFDQGVHAQQAENARRIA
jgi:hypothetical protein